MNDAVITCQQIEDINPSNLTRVSHGATILLDLQDV